MIHEEEETQIKDISEEYFDSFYNCLDSVARERLYLALVRAPPLEETRKFLSSGLDEGVIRKISVKQGNVIGWCDISPGNNEGFTHSGRLAMGVIKKYRGRGIGKRLLINAIAEVKKKGIERIELEVYSSNIPALTLYEKHGFVREGVKVKARKLDGVYEDIIEMALIL
ncbi:MAG: GNAT family N-acetyltransferase [Candidatus Bathyarchaeia archaeon]|jgi:ribosomal protein S18 acetylase RimI-like enzyme